jgi:hypothetical protein
MVDLHELEPLDLPQRTPAMTGAVQGAGWGVHPGTVPPPGKFLQNSPVSLSDPEEYSFARDGAAG